ncbi:MAG: hypothetical protein ABR552_00950 [Actinomycetota bacterium]
MSRVTDYVKGRSRREQMIIAAGIVLLIAVIGYALVSSGGGSNEPESIGPSLKPRTSTPTPTPSGAGTVVGATGEGRNPFEPGIGSSGAPGGGPPPTPSSGGPGGPNPSGEQRRVTLIDVFKQGDTPMATVSVADKNYTVKKGQTFATNFQVLDITDRCGTFLFGDERFSLCIGQEILK